MLRGFYSSRGLYGSPPKIFSLLTIPYTTLYTPIKTPKGSTKMNPLKQYREEYNLSQKDLADRAGITEQVILKAEQGMYPTIPPALLWALCNITGYSSTAIEKSYEEWIWEALHNVKLPLNADKMVTDHVLFRDWMGSTCALNDVADNVNSFCRLMKIHPYVISKYVSGKMKGVPVQLVERIATIRGVL